MGILQLKTFIESDENRKKMVCVDVKLLEVAEEWRKTGGKSIIVVDGHHISRRFLHDYDFVCGGEYKAIRENLESFVKFFKEIGVDLVFFFEEAERNKELTISKAWQRNNDKEEVDELFRRIEEVPILQQSTLSFTPLMFSRVVMDAAKYVAGVSVCIKVNKYRYRGMVEFVIENECLGVLTDDTDLFVFDGVPHAFSRDSLCLETMTTVEYRRTALLEILDLPGKAMPIFSTLMGNKALLFEDSKNYYNRLLGINARQSLSYLPRKVGILVRIANHIFEESEGDFNQTISLLAMEIFGLAPGDPRPAYIMDCLEESLLSYETFRREPVPVRPFDSSAAWNELLEHVKKLRTPFRFGKKTITVMKYGTYSHNGCLESCEAAKAPVSERECRVDAGEACASELRCMCSSQVFFEYRRRMYSVILFEKCVPYGSREFVEEFFTTGCRDQYNTSKKFKAATRNIYLVSTIPIDVEHPGLYRLWYEDSALDCTRWKLFLWICSSGICDLKNYDGVSVFRKPSLQDHLGFVGFTLLYLYEVMKVLVLKELEVLLVMTSSVPVMSADELYLRKVECVKKRAVTVSTVYQDTCYAIRWASKLCNLNFRASMCDLYSGLWFHYLFQQDHPTDILDELPSQAKTNYETMLSALRECCEGF